MQYFAAFAFFGVGFILITLVFATLVVLTRWTRIPTGWINIGVLLATGASLFAKDGFNLQTLTRTLVVVVIFMAAMELGIHLGLRVLQHEESPYRKSEK